MKVWNGGGGGRDVAVPWCSFRRCLAESKATVILSRHQKNPSADASSLELCFQRSAVLNDVHHVDAESWPSVLRVLCSVPWGMFSRQHHQTLPKRSRMGPFRRLWPVLLSSVRTSV